MNNFILLNEFLDSGINVNEIGQLALELAEPIAVQNDNREAVVPVPRNHEFYEVTIASYMGNLFVEHFRMTRRTLELLLQVLANVRPLEPGTVPFEKKVLFTIWILAKPESFLAAGDRFGFARSTAHNYFKEIISRIIAIMPQVITWPADHQESIQAFHERSHGFPQVIGAIDGSHIPIKQPSHNAHDYYNRKQFHSIILQGICDHRMVFIDISVGTPGRMHDARVYRRSEIYNRITNVENPLIPQDMHLLGDSAYPLMTNLLTPYRDNGHLNDIQINYNIKLSTIRSIIERAFGRLKGKFRRLKSLDIGSPEFGNQIIASACVLHNFIICNDVEENYNENDDEAIPNPDYILEANEINMNNEKRDLIANMIY